MFRTAHRFRRMLVLATVAALVAPNFVQAQHGGGGHFGGGHVGGGGFSRGGSGSYHSYGGYRSAFPHEYHRFDHGRPYYRGYYPYYSYYPYSDYSGALDNGYGVTTEPAYTDSVVGATAEVAPGASYQFYPAPSSGTTAQITVKVPPDAQVWFDGTLMTATGPVRNYQSPPLPAGRYQYEVRARWNENGREVTQTQHIGVTPGALVEVDFPVQSGADAQNRKAT
jgi:uncharacterized protein (TIGR03000 family)